MAHHGDVGDLAQRLLALAAVAADILGQVHARGAGFLHHSLDFVDHRAAAHDECAAECAQFLVEFGQCGGEEVRAIGRAAIGHQRLVDDEQRHHLVGIARGRGEHRVVVHAQVAGEQGDGDAHRAQRGATPSRPPVVGEVR